MGAADTFRVALFHTEFGRDGPGLLYRDILRNADPQIEAGLRIIEHIDADVLILGGIDHDEDRLALNALADRLATYPHRFAATPNRGRVSGQDFNRNGRLGDPDDAFGYGEFRGANNLAILSRYPILDHEVGDYTRLSWTGFPDNISPAGTLELERISTTVHLRVPIRLPGGGEVSFVVWHATPPVFDGPEDRNGRRNHDEIALALEMIEEARRPVVVAALVNLDPVDGEGRKTALERLLDHPQMQDAQPSSTGALRAALEDGGANARHRGDAALDTVDWPDEGRGPGNLRVDYILADRAFMIARSGVLWPATDGPLRQDVLAASRHRIVWMDLVFPHSD